MNRKVAGSIVGVVASVGLGAAMIPLRSHLSIATCALVLVVPVVAGVVTGGLVAGLVSVIAGFLVFDYAFIPPYYTLTVGAAEHWVALGVYVVVMVLVAQVVAHLESARSEAQRRAIEVRRLLELSELLVEDRPLPELLETIVDTVRTVFGVAGVALLLPADEGGLRVAASVGENLREADLARLGPAAALPVRVGTASGGPDGMRTIALGSAQRPVGMLATHGLPVSPADRELLGAFANHAALAIERSQLREEALRSELLQEVDRLRSALLGAVSHDLRTPLATMKVASSTLVDPSRSLSQGDIDELHGLIDVQADRLTRLVTSLLDMTRFQAGVLEVRRAPWSVLDLVAETLAGLRPALAERQVDVDLPDWLPPVSVDHLLIGQVLANLLDNANRHGPPGSAITVSGEPHGDRIALSVADHGPGIPTSEREAVFNRFVHLDVGGLTGLGLAIAKAFVEAHGERIWVEETPGGGARFVFTLPLAAGNGKGQA